jgi:ABC-type glycerol-3-phosphate transport system substrate-binding protein
MAAQSGLIQPLEGQIATATLGDLTSLSNSILELGQVDNQLYGVPYMLEILVVAYRPTDQETTYDSWRFEDVLTRGQPFVFPVGRANPLNNTFYVQYLSAGGTPLQGGVFTVNENALLTVLSFYQQAYETGIVDKALVNYIAPSDYQLELVNATIDTAVVSSTTFLTLHAQGVDLLVAPVPTHSGQMATQLNGWMWVMPTSDPVRQTLAARFLEWMMDADRQEQYAQSIYMLPSQRNALQAWDDSELDTGKITAFLTNAYLPLAASDSGTAVRAMQSALVSVIIGDRTAEEATQDVLNQING